MACVAPDHFGKDHKMEMEKLGVRLTLYNAALQFSTHDGLIYKEPFPTVFTNAPSRLAKSYWCRTRPLSCQFPQKTSSMAFVLC